MKDLLLKGDELQQLLTYIGKIPTDFGAPIKEFFTLIITKRAQEESVSKEEVAVKVVGEEPAPKGKKAKA
jgi:hypothetical protein